MADALAIADWVGQEIGFDLTAELREVCARADLDRLESPAQAEGGDTAQAALRALELRLPRSDRG
ncbi:hypothetical protein GCM10010345_18240 [Streptomyces canarius]|uniref:Uncharacterized protein n=1 Tax=Streptomyces canarius TaxID=285453 RepID=A0ABQ3CGU4_9ACTN|nr:hypothetical protein GCM10010345_18240 [Streptomyces canarius]